MCLMPALPTLHSPLVLVASWCHLKTFGGKTSEFRKFVQWCSSPPNVKGSTPPYRISPTMHYICPRGWMNVPPVPLDKQDAILPHPLQIHNILADQEANLLGLVTFACCDRHLGTPIHPLYSFTFSYEIPSDCTILLLFFQKCSWTP